MNGIPGISIRVADPKNPEDCVEMDIVTGNSIDLEHAFLCAGYCGQLAGTADDRNTHP